MNIQESNYYQYLIYRDAILKLIVVYSISFIKFMY